MVFAIVACEALGCRFWEDERVHSCDLGGRVTVPDGVDARQTTCEIDNSVRARARCHRSVAASRVVRSSADSPNSQTAVRVSCWSARTCYPQDHGESAVLYFTVFNSCDVLVRCDAELNASTYLERSRCP